MARSETELVATCKARQGEFLPGDHGPGSWATTYSKEFIDAASELYLIHKNKGHRKALSFLVTVFKSNGIRSCRGAEMNVARVEYLYDSRLCHLVKNR
jgi:hypothetical protein